MKKLLSLVFCAVLMISFCAVGTSAYSVGNGVVYVYTEDQLNSVAKNFYGPSNIVVMNDIFLKNDLYINRNISIDLGGHSLVFARRNMSCHIGYSRSVYSVYTPVKKVDYYNTSVVTTTYNNTTYTSMSQVPVEGVYYYFNRYDYFDNIRYDEYSRYCYTEYGDDIQVNISNGRILGYTGNYAGGDALNVISGNVYLNDLTICGGNGADGKRGKDARRGVFINSKANDGEDGYNGGFAIIINRGNVYAQNCYISGGNGGNGGNGGDSNVSRQDRILSRALNGEAGRAGKGSSAVKVYGSNSCFMDQGVCTVISGINGIRGMDGTDFYL